MAKLFTGNKAIIWLLASILVTVAARYFDIEIWQEFAVEYVEFTLQVAAASYAIICILIAKFKW